MTPRRSNASFATAVAAALVCFFLVDSFLYGHEGFLALTGQGTQEAQIVSKARRARRLAAAADVIAFGSSFVRSGLSGEPFLDRGILPFNFAVSGGGPLYSYFALKEIESVLSARSSKPLLLVELKRDALEAVSAAWSEYPQYIGIVRSRREMFVNAPMLWRHFAAFGMTSPFLSSMVVPSSIYRSHVVQLLGAARTLDDYFYGMEDFSGYSPLYSVAQPSLRDLAPVTLASFRPEKIEFLRAFLSLAFRIGAPVVLYESPTPFVGQDDGYEPLTRALAVEFPALRVLEGADQALSLDDFDEGGHPNLRGADMLSAVVIRALGVRGDAITLADRIRSAFEVVDLAPATHWANASGVSAVASAAVQLDGTASEPVLARLPPITVVPGREYIIEARTQLQSGELFVTAAWNRRGSGPLVERSVGTPPVGFDGGAARIMLRVVPRHSRLTISILDHAAAVGQPASRGRIELLRVWGDRG